jgi:predicted AAA+ superfamily ATPase
MLDRLIFPRISKTQKSVVLLGPRQVGKSTLCRSLAPDKIINLMDEAAYLGYSKDAAKLSREIRALAKPSLIFIDEIQRVPALLNSIQSLLDENPKHKFILTGSSARKLKRGGANLLPGRVIVESLDPLTIWELGERFDLEKCLTAGCLPGVYLDEEDGLDILESYANIYLREEIQAEALVKNIGGYARFLDVAAEASGDWINYSKVASDAEIPKESVRRFFSILEETLLVFRIPPFKAKKSERRISQRDKFIFFDPGVRNALLKMHRSALSASEKGKLFEQWLLLQCLYFIRAHKKPWTVSAYRTESGAEVDLVIDTGRRFLAIECKSGKNIPAGAANGLRSFAEIAHKPVEKFLVYQGDTAQKLPGDESVWPFAVFLTDYLPSLP